MSSIRNNHGFVLLFAVLIASILLSVGLALSNISFKEIVLSAASRDSQFAFFGSDSGSECAFYWDRKFLENNLPQSPFAENTATVPFDENNPPPAPWDAVKCNDVVVTTKTITGWTVSSTATAATTTFTFRLGATDKEGCVTVSVAKNLPTGHVLPDTKITAIGASSCLAGDPRAVERTVESNIPGF